VDDALVDLRQLARQGGDVLDHQKGVTPAASASRCAACR
jgi:hypothetical protein